LNGPYPAGRLGSLKAPAQWSCVQLPSKTLICPLWKFAAYSQLPAAVLAIAKPL